MSKTTNYNLDKPNVDQDIQSETIPNLATNFDIIDTNMQSNKEKGDTSSKFIDNSLMLDSDLLDITEINRHYPILLETPTYDGSGEIVHPDVVYIDEGFGSLKWRYWMANTPMKDRNDQYENPSVIVSHDGVTWETPDGLINPIVDTPTGVDDHNSDTDMVFYDNKLWLFYRQTLKSVSPYQNRIFLTTSLNGIDWSTPQEIFYNDAMTDSLMSPSVIYKDGKFQLWTVNGAGNLMKSTSTDGITWSSLVNCSFIGMPSGYQEWHIDVIANNNRLEMIVNVTDTNKQIYKLQFAYSEDDGITWYTSSPFINQLYDFEKNRHYRATLLPLKNNPNIYELWYSSLSDKNRYRVAYLNLIRINNTIYPFTPSNMKWITMQGISSPMVSAGKMATQELTVGGDNVGNRIKLGDWVTANLVNGWEVHTQFTVKFYINGMDEVHLAGRAMSGTSTDGTVIFTLPEAYRPKQPCIFRQRYGDVYVDSDGTVKIYSFNLDGTTYPYIAFDGIVFRTH